MADNFGFGIGRPPLLMRGISLKDSLIILYIAVALLSSADGSPIVHDLKLMNETKYIAIMP